MKLSYCITALSCLLTGLSSHGSIPIGKFEYEVLHTDPPEMRICGPAEGVTLSGDIELPAHVVRPSTGETYVVVEIGDPGGNIRDGIYRPAAFAGQTQITSVYFPSTIRYIDWESFDGCTGIERFRVSSANENYISVDGLLFGKNTKGKPETLYRFPPASPLTTYTIPSWSAKDCVGGKRLVHWGAFRDNKNLKTLVVDNTIAFYTWVFLGNKGIKTIKGDPFGCVQVNGMLLSVDKTELRHVPPALTTGVLEIPPTVTRIEDYGCASVQAEAVNFNNVTTIGDCAFSGARLKNVNVPKTVTQMGDGLFEYCTSLTSATIEAPIVSLPYNTFEGCGKLSSVKLPATCKELQGSVFYGCKALTSFSLSGFTKMKRPNLGDWGHFAYTSIASVNMPSGLETIPEYAYMHCTKLTSLTLHDNTKYIEPLAFYNTSLETFNSKNLYEIQNYAFENCQSLRKIVLAESDHKLSLGLTVFRINAGAEIFINHKDLGFVGWAGEDWPDAFYGWSNDWDNYTLYTSWLRPKTFLEEWGTLYCPWGVATTYRNMDGAGEVHEMFELSRDKTGAVKVTPNYSWVKITGVTENAGAVDINYTARDVKMHTVYPANFKADAGVDEVFEDTDREFSVITKGHRVTVTGTENTELTVYNMSGQKVLSLQSTGDDTFTLPSAGIYIVKAGAGQSLIRKIMIK